MTIFFRSLTLRSCEIFSNQFVKANYYLCH